MQNLPDLQGGFDMIFKNNNKRHQGKLFHQIIAIIQDVKRRLAAKLLRRGDQDKLGAGDGGQY